MSPYHTHSVFEELVKDFDWLVEQCNKHQSVDTFAKKLYLKGNYKDLKRLKTILSIYFLIIQSKNKVDIRYDTFFASILDINLRPPDNLRILTWNYDYQLEKAYAEYYGDPRLDACQNMLNVYSKNSRVPHFNADRFGIVKINGTASLILDLDKSYPYNMIGSVETTYDSNLIEIFLQHYASLHHVGKTKEKLTPALSFVWEDYSNGMVAIKNAVEATSNTEILVVIGYSFPFFNRFVDRDIIRGMSKLKRVYFQSPDAELLKERFLAIRNDIKNDDLIVKKDVYQFVFPNEL